MRSRPVRSVAAKIMRPAIVALDRRLDALATRLERHTERLAVDQRTEIQRIDDRLTLDVAVMSEHLISTERTARRATAVPAARVRIALPGEALVTDDVPGAVVVAYAADADGAWTRVESADHTTLRIMALPSSPGA